MSVESLGMGIQIQAKTSAAQQLVSQASPLPLRVKVVHPPRRSLECGPITVQYSVTC